MHAFGRGRRAAKVGSTQLKQLSVLKGGTLSQLRSRPVDARPMRSLPQRDPGIPRHSD